MGTWFEGHFHTGKLYQNQIHQHGVLTWPDGRRYVGHFENEAMQGEGTLSWSDKDGPCRYKGNFRNNVFHGEGVLEWSSKARYSGEFHDGLYHGDGMFEWPDQSMYRGQWQEGEMHGRGVLTKMVELRLPISQRAEPFIYVGEFVHGHMQGGGHICWFMKGNRQDEYRGEFAGSMLHGHGTFTWS